MSGWSGSELAELRAENSQRYAADGINHSCLFDSDSDDRIESGYNCGGCSCHLRAPCDHCLSHLDPEESDYISTMLNVQGRWTR